MLLIIHIVCPTNMSPKLMCIVSDLYNGLSGSGARLLSDASSDKLHFWALTQRLEGDVINNTTCFVVYLYGSMTRFYSL